uniref:Cadherin domain-containing protein n=1 Tax=Biomphalaria glabrata TaxID=6526 RepID=A0A2C9M776_BIOGL
MSEPLIEKPFLSITSLSQSGIQIPIRPSAQVIVRITDINDNNPTFAQSAYLFNVTEGQAVGTLLGSVLATDNDLPNSPNSAITYSIVLATDSYLFNINAGTGQLTTNYVFDYEVKKQYIILVKASDGGSPSRDAVVPVTVNILDVNDNKQCLQAKKQLEH